MDEQTVEIHVGLDGWRRLPHDDVRRSQNPSSTPRDDRFVPYLDGGDHIAGFGLRTDKGLRSPISVNCFRI